MNLRGIMKSLGAKPGQVVSDPYARAFAPQISEAEGSQLEEKVDVTKLKKGDKVKINMGRGKEEVEVMGNFKTGVSKTAFVTLKRKAGAPYIITLSKLEKVLTEAEESEDHEVSMAKGSLEAIQKHAGELLQKLGNEEKDIPGWIQDHIAKSENYIQQANDQYHEYGKNESVKEVEFDEIKVLSKEEFQNEVAGDTYVVYLVDGEGNKKKVKETAGKTNAIRLANRLMTNSKIEGAGWMSAEAWQKEPFKVS